MFQSQDYFGPQQHCDLNFELMQFHAKLGKNWNPPKKKEREKNKNKSACLYIIFLVSLVQGWYLKHTRISEKFLTLYCSNVAISTFQGWFFILFWTFHVKNKIFQIFIKKIYSQFFFFGIYFYLFEIFNISGIDIIQCLVKFQ